MTSNKILLTGMATNNDMYGTEDGCFACTYNFSWIFNNPSTVLWTDKIILTPTIKNIVDSKTWPEGKSSPIAETLKIFFDVAGEYDLLEIKDPSKDFQFIQSDLIDDQIDKDIEILPKVFKNIKFKTGKKENEPDEILIDNFHYCRAKIISFYLSGILSRLWQAQLLMDNSSYSYLSHKLSLPGDSVNQSLSVPESFHNLFQSYLPEIDLWPVSGDQNCFDCAQFHNCAEPKSPRNAEKAIREYLQWRNYDELHQMKEIHQNILKKYSDHHGDIDQEDLRNEFKIIERKINKKIHETFPKVQRWSGLTTILSIPIIVAGVTTQSPFIAGLGASVTGMSQIAKNYTDILTNKNRWLLFRHDKLINKG